MISRFSTHKLAIGTAALLALSALSSAQEAGVSAAKKAYARTGDEITLTGTITLTGKRPKPLTIDMSADPSCYEVNSNPKTEWVVGNKGKLANVLVYVTSEALDTYTFQQPTSPVLLEHKGCRYAPHVLAMRTGQQLTIQNNDPTYHNTHPTPKSNAEWNQTQPQDAPALVKKFNRPELFMPFKCNQHPWEKAYVSVFDHPFFAVSDEFGNYRIEGLPPGRYTVVALHERFGEKAVEITFVSGEARALSFNFDAGSDSRE